MKTLADILSECRHQAQKTVDVIDKMIGESKDKGIIWPETEDKTNLTNVCYVCDGTGCQLCGWTGVIDEDDPGYDQINAETKDGE